jgi:hypothetical protein
MLVTQESINKMIATKRRQGEIQRARSPKHVLPDKKIVYLHYHNVTKEFFWCGHGNWARPTRTSNRTKLWKDHVAEHGPDWEVIRVQTGVDPEFAWWFEKNLTAQIGNIHDGTGPLLNHTGKRGKNHHTPEECAKISESITVWHAQRRLGG